MIDEAEVQARAFRLWDGKGRQPGLLAECLEQARAQLMDEAQQDNLAADGATAPPPSQTRPSQLFQEPNADQADIDRRGRTIESNDDQPLMRTQTQGVRQG